jgi:hypothetical protein
MQYSGEKVSLAARKVDLLSRLLFSEEKKIIVR